MKFKPLPYRLSQFGSGTEILYKCPNCGSDFRILGKQELYCHHCGKEIDWETSPTYCSQEFKEEYDNLVYKQYAHINGNRDIDKKLVDLLYRLYKGEIS